MHKNIIILNILGFYKKGDKMTLNMYQTFSIGYHIGYFLPMIILMILAIIFAKRKAMWFLFIGGAVIQLISILGTQFSELSFLYESQTETNWFIYLLITFFSALFIWVRRLNKHHDEEKAFEKKLKKSNIQICPECGGTIKPNDKFCPKCHYKP